jgi:feruloyl esterase
MKSTARRKRIPWAISSVTLFLAAALTRPEVQTATSYSEPWRLQFHYSQPERFMNDPNVLAYHDGEWHLFCQYGPGNGIVWGRAVSKDLLHWENLPIAIPRQEEGKNPFSGSAVIDRENTSGFGRPGTPAMVAVYTAAGRGSQAQALAYSLNKGRRQPSLPRCDGERRPRGFLLRAAPPPRTPSISTGCAPSGRLAKRSVLMKKSFAIGACATATALTLAGYGETAAQAPAASRQGSGQTNVAITAADCTAVKVGTSLASSAIGEPVRAVTLSEPTWVAATDDVPAHCRVNGTMAPIDTAPTARPINFGVALPASWGARAAQIGGGGFNGFVPNLTGGAPGGGTSLLARGFATYGSDSGHQAALGRRGGPPRGDGPAAPPPGANVGDDWTLNAEAIANLGYMQMKKTRDAAMVIMERVYGRRPRFNYYLGSSQGGREALTVAQRYPADYDGIAANVPIVAFSTLMLAPELIRIQEKPLANWVTPAKVNAIRGEFIRQCDSLDGLADGIINNYIACRAIFDVTQGAANRKPWAAKRCPNNVDPNPADTSANACLTDGQISTLEFTYSRYRFVTPLAHGQRTFGMWMPNTDPSGSGLILNARFRGQEGAGSDAPMHSHLGVLGVTGFVMKNPSANPLDYVEGGAFDRRRLELSPILDSTSPDLSAFAKRGGKMIVTIGTNDTLASPGAQLDYYQAVLDRMGRSVINRFARLFVMPQADHGLRGTNHSVTGDGRTVPAAPIPNRYDQWGLLFDWVENGIAPGMSVTVTAGEKSLPLCSYPAYPRYKGGPVESAASYACAQ